MEEHSIGKRKGGAEARLSNDEISFPPLSSTSVSATTDTASTGTLPNSRKMDTALTLSFRKSFWTTSRRARRYHLRKLGTWTPVENGAKKKKYGAEWLVVNMRLLRESTMACAMLTEKCHAKCHGYPRISPSACLPVVRVTCSPGLFCVISFCSFRFFFTNLFHFDEMVPLKRFFLQLSEI